MVPEKRLSSAKIKLIIKNPFIGSILSYLKFVESSEHQTFAVDSKNLYYNRLFMRTVSDENLKFILAHEALHIAGLHHLRMGKKDKYIWNQACDYVVNRMLFQSNVGIMPEDCLYDEKYDQMSAEEIYNILKNKESKKSECKNKESEQQSNGSGNKKTGESDGAGNKEDRLKSQGQGQSSGQDQNSHDDKSLSTGHFEPFEGSAEEFEREKGKSTRRVEQCRNMAQMCGNISGDIDQFVKEASLSVISWVDILREEFETIDRVDYTFLKPNIRYSDFIVPGLKNGKKVGDICIMIDTSGSMTVEFLSQIKKEIKDLFEDVEPEKITLIECDCEVQRVLDLEDIDMWDEKKFKGRGGTSLAPPFKYLQDNQIEPEIIIYFTDLCARREDLNSSFISEDVLMYWVKFGNYGITPPFGKVIEYLKHA